MYMCLEARMHCYGLRAFVFYVITYVYVNVM
jgi:hypothetical protein